MKISVIVLAYNEEKFLERCLRSIYSQVTIFDFEVIVVDDASTDATADILKASPFPIKLITNKENTGIGYSAAVGLSNSTGRYFVRVDGDDYVSEHFLQTLGLCIITRELNAVSCDYYVTDEASNIIGYGDFQITPIACGIIYNKDFLVSIGGYNAASRIFEDLDLRERLLKKTPIVNIPIPLYRYRAHRDNSTGTGKVLKHISRS